MGKKKIEKKTEKKINLENKEWGVQNQTAKFFNHKKPKIDFFESLGKSNRWMNGCFLIWFYGKMKLYFSQSDIVETKKVEIKKFQQVKKF